MVTDIYLLASRLFKPLVKQFDSLFIPLNEDLRRAHLRIIREQWAAIIFLAGFAAWAISFVLGLALLLASHAFTATAFLLLIPISAAIGLTAGAVIYYYHATVAGERKKKDRQRTAICRDIFKHNLSLGISAACAV